MAIIPLMQKKVLFFIGTRPELIKLAPLVASMERRPDEFQVHVCLTSQHSEMLQQALRQFPIKADTDLGIMRDDQTLSDVVAAVLEKSAPLIDSYQPDLIVVQGNTATTFAGALAGFHANVPVVHIEAGLRSDNRHAPWPEEVYRTMVVNDVVNMEKK